MSDDYSSSVRLVVAPSEEPLTFAQAKTFLRIEHTADDDAISRAITAARLAAEQYIRAVLLPQTWEYSVANPACSKLYLPWGPAQSIISIVLTTEDGATSTMNAANYRLSVDGCAVLIDSFASIEKMTVRYVAGLANSASQLPASILQGMLHHITVMLENRNGAEPLPVQSIACYEPFRRMAL